MVIVVRTTYHAPRTTHFMISFLKMHGLGNDFVVIDNRDASLPALYWRQVADRHTGIGCDQAVVLEPSAKADIFMRIYNADGGEVASCGNASRCVAWLIALEKGALPRKVTIETQVGILNAEVKNALQVTVDMGAPRLEWQDIPLARACDTLHLPVERGDLKDAAAVSMGNPHCVFFVDEAAAVALAEMGPELEHHALFPERANINIAQIGKQMQNGLDWISLRVWERGAGLTLACGTGACATLVAAHLRGLTGRKAFVELPGGGLFIEWREDDHVWMTGPVETAFRGAFDPEPWLVREGAVHGS